jgi:hypothetical protein
MEVCKAQTGVAGVIGGFFRVVEVAQISRWREIRARNDNGI